MIDSGEFTSTEARGWFSKPCPRCGQIDVFTMDVTPLEAAKVHAQRCKGDCFICDGRGVIARTGGNVAAGAVMKCPRCQGTGSKNRKAVTA